MDWVAFWDAKASEPGAASIGRSTGTVGETFTLLAHVAYALKLEPADSLLDVGCGSGVLGRHLRACVSRYLGVDASREQLRRFADADPGASINVMDARDLTVADTSYSKVAYVSVLQYMPDMDAVSKVFAEAHRILKPGGRAFFALNPLATHCEEYIKGIPAGREDSRRAAEESLWFDVVELPRLARVAGFASAEWRDVPLEVWQSWYQRSLLCVKGE